MRKVKDTIRERHKGYSFDRGVRRSAVAARALVLVMGVALVAYSATNDQNQQGLNSALQQASLPDWKPVEQALGKAGSMQPGDVYKVSLPRSDLKVTVAGVELKPALALGSWVAFKRVGDMTVVMGDLVLAESEVTPVLSKLQQGRIETTALHNHVLNESPRVMYMHIHAMGDAVKIAKAIHDALALTKTRFTAPAATSPNQDIGIDTKQIDQIMGQSGKVNGGVYQYSIARADEVTDAPMMSGEKRQIIPPAMGIAQAINKLAGGLRAALDKVNVKRT
ncbi:MAG: DUF1259 domain-containing protein [Acidobacteria bacterium]|nr:DUF1259 domain-containing protein [Acidobacteriota bacterium]